MEATSPTNINNRSFGTNVFNFFSSFTLATVLLLILLLQTWLATLEQVDHGLYDTLRKYFDPSQLFILGELKLPDFMGEKTLIIPMPGGYWVLGLLFINLFLGGIIRARKGWKKIGNFISHCGILLMIVSAAVTEWQEQRGTMDFFEGETSNVARDYHEYVVEITEYTNGKADRVHVIRGNYLSDLAGDPDFVRTVRLPELPFDMQFTRYAINSRVMSTSEMPPPPGIPVVDNYFVFERPGEKEAETNIASCYAKVLPKSGVPGPAFILSGDAVEPYTEKVAERTFAIHMRKFLWVMPFSVRLDKATSEYYPNTAKPKRFESRVTRIENGSEASVEIKMNEPMRYEGLTFYQRMMGGGMPGGAAMRASSQLEVVRNPADQWPKYALYIVTLGLFVQFVLKFVIYLIRNSQPKS
jgi:hypothetical protein